DKVADKFNKREVKGVEQDSTNFIQQLLQQAGFDMKLTPEEIKSNIAFKGPGTIVDYFNSKRDMGWEPEISPDILASGAKHVDQRSVAEFGEFKDAIDSLHYIGREERKIEIAGEKKEWEEFRKEVIENLRQLPLRERAKQGRWLYYMDAPLVRMEEIIK